jgi:hypothetical protein
MPAAANYEHGQVDPENQFTHAIPVGEPDPGDLNYRYELRATKALYGWAADLTVRSNVRPGGLSDEFARDPPGEFQQPADRAGSCHGSSWTEAAGPPGECHSGPGWLPGRGDHVWSKQATAHAAYATIDASVMNLWVVATRRQGDLEVSK